MFYGLCAALLFGPLAFGAVHPWSLFVLQVFAVLLFLLWVGRQLLSPDLVSLPIYPPLLLLGGLVAIQIVFGVSAYPYATVSEAMRYPAYAMLVVVGAHVLRRADRARTFALLLIVFGFLLAIFAMLQGWTSDGKLYWLISPRQAAPVYGPYINHNHYAGLMEMLTPFALVAAMANRLHGAQRVLASFAAVCMAASIFLSHSRGGMIAFTVQAAVLALFVVRKREIRFASACLLATALSLGLFLGQFGGEKLAARMQNLDTGYRLQTFADLPRMVTDRPLLGWGLGTFSDVYPRYRSRFQDLVTNETHNDYLQFLAETGVLGFAAVIWFMVALLRSGFGRIRRWDMEPQAAVRLGALIGTIGILVHSFSDFNLQIPANAALFYVLAALAVLDKREPPQVDVIR